MKVNIFFLLLVLAFSCKTKSHKFSFIENFESNKIGWVEETTDFHSFDIRNGVYYMNSKDTTFAQSSTGPIDISFLLDLPDKYLIETEIKYISGNENLECGIILVGASVQYKFSLTPKGSYFIKHYDYNFDQGVNLDSAITDKNPFQTVNSTAKIRILVSGQQLDFAVNDQYVGRAISQSEIWHDLRFFTGPPMAIEVLYLRIIELSEEDYQSIYGNEESNSMLST